MEGLASTLAGVTNTYQPSENTVKHHYSGKAKGNSKGTKSTIKQKQKEK